MLSLIQKEKKLTVKLSIIIPIYKEDEYIDECISSVLNEIKKSKANSDFYEIIIVSDGASINALNKISKYEHSFANFKLIKAEHRGAAAARNLGINEAKGEYIAFVDADDRMAEGFLCVCNKLIEQNKDLYIYGLRRIEGDKKVYQR